MAPRKQLIPLRLNKLARLREIKVFQMLLFSSSPVTELSDLVELCSGVFGSGVDLVRLGERIIRGFIAYASHASDAAGVLEGLEAHVSTTDGGAG